MALRKLNRQPCFAVSLSSRSRWERGEDNIDSNAEALIRVCATQELGLPTDTKVAEISGWCVQGADPQPLVIDGHDPSNYRLKKAA